MGMAARMARSRRNGKGALYNRSVYLAQRTWDENHRVSYHYKLYYRTRRHSFFSVKGKAG